MDKTSTDDPNLYPNVIVLSGGPLGGRYCENGDSWPHGDEAIVDGVATYRRENATQAVFTGLI